MPASPNNHDLPKTVRSSPLRQVTRAISIGLILQLTIQAIAFAAVSRANTGGSSSQVVSAKIEYCQNCHGALGQGYHGYYPIPRLAGQQTQYLENQLRAYAERRRKNDIMYNVARVLSPEMMAALAAHFQALNPKPLQDAPKRPVAMGEQIFQTGVPDANVAACAACHGPDGTGTGQIPRLAGQLYPYLVKVLTNFSQERGQNPANPDTSAIMKPVAHSLTPPQIEAVAAYVNSLK
jgi:cytochrome c553